MSIKYPIFLIILLGSILTGCQVGPQPNEIVQVISSSEAGPILPELQWYEEILITETGVTLIRSGSTNDTEINAGRWELAVAPQQVQVLFEQLEAVDYTIIERLEPDSPLDGGETACYTIISVRAQSYTLQYDPGTTYLHGELVVQPIENFLQQLTWPAEAVSRYK